MKTGIIIAIIGLAAVFALFHKNSGQKLPPVIAKQTSVCEGNTGKTAFVSIKQKKMEACDGSKLVKTAPVVTGYQGYVETLTPVGEYRINNKLTDQNLVGSDKLGDWNIQVKYWLPFLTNQYGDYGFHDANWRQNSSFGNIRPDSKQASHGCVELPDSSMAWLYGWVGVGTKVVVKA